MSVIRISCKTPPRPDGMHPGVTMLPSWHDVRVSFVEDDGTERHIDGVSAVSFECRPGNVTVARLEVMGVEVDVDGIIQPASPTHGLPGVAGRVCVT